MSRSPVKLALLLLCGALALVSSSSISADPGIGKPAEICHKVAEKNLMDPKKGLLRPGPEYTDGYWLRDSFWTTACLGPEVGRRALDQFGSRLTENGQAPTRINPKGIADQYYDDESTIIYIIWAARDGGQPRERLHRAWEWITGHVDVDTGAYWSPPGTHRTWHDTLRFPTWDVAAYNQGLYAVAALAAVEMGVGYPEQAEKAASFYRQLYRPELGYLPVSRYLDYHDASAVVGETLARLRFGHKLLTDEMVVDTVRSLSLAEFEPLSRTAFKVLSKANGDYLDDWAFLPWSMKGRYQNGGSWLLYDTIAWTALGLAGDEAGFKLARLRVQLETFHETFYEYISTGPAADHDHLPVHPDYAWNAYVCSILRE
ncbi:MAG: hypothetical protein ACUVX1_10585 [Chloroflexota bacterium]